MHAGSSKAWWGGRGERARVRRGQFDLVSPVDELAKQIRLEFDFEREARVMDDIGGHLRVRTPPPPPEGGGKAPRPFLLLLLL